MLLRPPRPPVRTRSPCGVPPPVTNAITSNVAQTATPTKASRRVSRCPGIKTIGDQEGEAEELEEAEEEVATVSSRGNLVALVRLEKAAMAWASNRTLPSPGSLKLQLASHWWAGRYAQTWSHLVPGLAGATAAAAAHPGATAAAAAHRRPGAKGDPGPCRLRSQMANQQTSSKSQIVRHCTTMF
jgi:hypothetical protein